MFALLSRPFRAGARASVFKIASLALFLATFYPLLAFAQQADIIRGRVTSSSSGDPVVGATVTATTLSGGITRPSRTDRNGRFTITFPNGEGDYWITVSFIGYIARRFEIKRTADQDILIADVRLAPSASSLDTVTVNGRRDRPSRRDTLDDIGGMNRGVNTANVAIEDLGNLALMAATTPGLLFIPGVNGDPAGYSAFGLDPSQNSTAINGMNSGTTDLPRDGEYGVGVALSPYDVSQGQFSGGRTNVRVGSGTNYVRSLSSLVLNTPTLQWTDRAGRALGQEYTNLNLGGGYSGPIALNSSFYNLSYQAGRVGNDLHTLFNTDPFGLQAAGIASDSVSRLREILQSEGIPAIPPGFPSSKHTDQGLLLGALDFAPPTSQSGRSIKLSALAGWSRATPFAAGVSSVPASLFENTSWNAAMQAQHTGYFKFGVLSETGVSYARTRRYASPFVSLPAGNVRVRSSFDDGTGGVESIAVGGSTFVNDASTNSFQLLNQLSWFTANNKHRLKLTTDLRYDSYDAQQTSNTLGAFTFNSLADLANGQPSSFARTLLSPRIASGAVIAGVALGDSYRPREALQIVYGLRLDANRFENAPARNANVEDAFGVQNDRLSNRVYLSPRVGFAWTYRTSSEVAAFNGAAVNPAIVVRGGVGVFQGVPSAQLPMGALANTGLPSGSQQLFCTGAAVPVPEWNAYRANTAAIPATCADGSIGTVFSDQTPSVTLFARDFAAPRSIRSNLQATRTIFDNFMRLTVGGVLSRNQHQPNITDLNFSGVSRFALDGEGGRPVFVNPSSISPTTGAVALRDARIAPEFSRVTALQSGLSSTARQLQLTLTPVAASTRYTWGVTYTNNSTRDRVNGFVNTGGSPFDFSSARSNYDWRHQFQLSAGYNLFDLIRVQWFHSFVSGVPFSPMVSGDINGDGIVNNDRAFIYDATSNASIAPAMAALLNAASSRTRACLQKQIGAVAARSSCEAPWTSTAALRIDFNPIRVRMPQRTMLSLSISNPLAGLDLLMHGVNNTHGWGQFKAPEERLLFVRGFDQATQQFKYDVNPRFGNTSPNNSALRSPVAITALVRVDLGPTREKQDLTRHLDRGRTTPGTKATLPEIRNAYSSAGIVNPLSVILRNADSLHLNGDQADSLASMNRWFMVRLDSIWTSVAKEFAALPDRYPRGAVYTRYVRAREASVDLLLRMSPAINQMLTGMQKRKLPPLTASYLDVRYLRALRSRTPGISAPVFPPPAGTAGETGGRARGGGP